MSNTLEKYKGNQTRVRRLLDAIEENNKEKLEDVFHNIDFNSEANLGCTKKRNECLKNLLNDFNDISI